MEIRELLSDLDDQAAGEAQGAARRELQRELANLKQTVEECRRRESKIRMLIAIARLPR